MTNPLYVEKKGDMAILVFNRPKKKNAFTLAMFQELSALLDDLENDPNIRVLIVRGVDETAFSAGADITEFLDVRYNTEKAKAYNDAALKAIEKLYRFSRPTIALIQKLAIGGGLELANSCDFRFASADGKFGITAANIGIIYNLKSTKRLMNLVGVTKAKELLYTAKLIGAHEARDIGLIDYVYPADELEEQCFKFARKISEKSLVANSGIKRVVHNIMDGANDEDEELAQLILDSFSSEDYEEGIQAFLEKRRPDFSRNKKDTQN